MVGKMTLLCPLNPSLQHQDSKARLTFCSAINQRFQALFIFLVDHVHQRRVDPSPRRDRVEPGDDNIELHVKVVTKILDLVVMSST